ncbi:hypothetical protein RND71_016556 [Anisodus tanguticus]|uniref:Uncharacterized protein n=1 Tax=Anisodus tanguticus TaxID=243964 RepID=A0AAE1VCX4_9SOLA|nr:hypothetical protein RND71_016556 [Anisodus tanguticus]
MFHQLKVGMDNPHGADQDLRLHWSVPCGPNSVITFPDAPWLKPWYWWSWPVLPLGIQWHEQRRQTLGYDAEMPLVMIQTVLYLGIIVMTRPNLSKFCYRREDTKSIFLIRSGLKSIAIWSILAPYIVPFFLIPRTVHPLIGRGILGALLVMAYPWYSDGVREDFLPRLSESAAPAGFNKLY